MLPSDSLCRVVCLSSSHPAASPADVLAVCHGFPDRRSQSGIGGKILCFGEQFVLLLEGKASAVERLVERIGREAPEAELTVRSQETTEERAFSSWSIGDLYLDEVGHRDPAALEAFGDLLIDLFAGEVVEDRDTFAELVALAERFTTVPTAPRRDRQVVAA